jgi:hypothetical protein
LIPSGFTHWNCPSADDSIILVDGPADGLATAAAKPDRRNSKFESAAGLEIVAAGMPDFAAYSVADSLDEAVLALAADAFNSAWKSARLFANAASAVSLAAADGLINRPTLSSRLAAEAFKSA